MKYEKLFKAIGPLLIIAGSITKILHWPYAERVLFLGLVVLAVVQTMHVSILKQRVKELEAGAKPN